MGSHGGLCLDKSTTDVAPLWFRKTIFFSRPLSWFVNWHISQGVSIMVVAFLRAHTLLIGDNCDLRPFGWREMFPYNRCVNNVKMANKVLWYFYSSCFFWSLFISFCMSILYNNVMYNKCSSIDEFTLQVPCPLTTDNISVTTHFSNTHCSFSFTYWYTTHNR